MLILSRSGRFSSAIVDPLALSLTLDLYFPLLQMSVELDDGRPVSAAAKPSAGSRDTKEEKGGVAPPPAASSGAGKLATLAAANAAANAGLRAKENTKDKSREARHKLLLEKKVIDEKMIQVCPPRFVLPPSLPSFPSTSTTTLCILMSVACPPPLLTPCV